MNNTIVISLAISLFLNTAVAQTPGFSLHNKSKNTILIEVTNNQSLAGKAKSLFIQEVIPVLKSKFYDQDIDIHKTTSFTISDKKGDILYQANFTPDKTIYVNWDGKELYPQRGPLLGVTKKTDLGYSTKNNVNKNDITIVKNEIK